MSSKDTIYDKMQLQNEEFSKTIKPERVTAEEGLYGEEQSVGSVQIIASDHIINFNPKPLTEEEARKSLSMIGKTAKGDGYTYLKATCNAMSLTDVTVLVNFQHLQFIHLSNNYLDLAGLQPLTKLPYLVSLHADVNILKSAALEPSRCLQVLVLTNNKIPSVNDVYQPQLSTLDMGFNKIARVDFDQHMDTLRCLDFRHNFIIEINTFKFPNLDSLYLAGNRISSLEGLDQMINLRVLHLRNNPVKKLDGFSENLVKLQYINLRNCKIDKRKQLKKLKCLVALETLILRGCPVMGGKGEETSEMGEEEEEEDIQEMRIVTIATLMRLKRFNKNIITPDEYEEALAMFKQWLDEGDKEEEDEFEEEEEEQY